MYIYIYMICIHIYIYIHTPETAIPSLKISAKNPRVFPTIEEKNTFSVPLPETNEAEKMLFSPQEKSSPPILQSISSVFR